MFTSNKKNHLIKSILRQKFRLSNNDILDEIQGFSYAIFSSPDATIFFAIIQLLILHGRFEQLFKIKQNCFDHLSFAIQHQLDTTIHHSFIEVIEDILEKIALPTQISTIIETLFNKKQKMEGYINWLIITIGQVFVNNLSEQYKLKILSYSTLTIDEQQAELTLVHEDNVSKQNDSLEEIRIVNINNEFHILYTLTEDQIYSVSRLFWGSVNKKY